MAAALAALTLRRVVALAGVALLIVALAVSFGGEPEPVASPPPFLRAQLGAPAPESVPVGGAARRLTPAPGVAATLAPGRVTAAGRQGTVSLASAEAGVGEWEHFRNGAARATSFGAETVTVSADQVEESLVVDSHQNTRTWRWRVGSGELTPRIGADGSVGFLAGRRLREVYIKPVAILDARGGDITPDGLRWSLEDAGGHSWLTLTLDDSQLPTPYVIDPAIVLRGTPSSANNGTSAGTTLVLGVPGGVAVNDLLLAQVSVGGGSGTTITPPACGCWTLVRRDDAGTNLAQAIYRHVATGSEPGSYTWTFTSNRAAGGIVAYQGVDISAPVDAQSGAADNSGASTAVAAPTLTTTGADRMLVGFFGIRSTSTLTPPAGMAEQWDTTGGSGPGPSAEAADVLQPAAGASGAKTAAATSAGQWVGQAVALTPDAANPANALTLSSVSPASSALLSGTTVFYRGTGGGAGGSFQLTNTVTDGGSGPASSAFPALGGTTTGWTHTAQTISTPSGGPYVSTNAFSWSEGTSSSPTEAVVGSDNAGNTTTTTLTFTNDSTGPTGSVTAPASSANVRGAAVSVSSSSADGSSGVASAVFQRSPAGAGTWTTISTDTVAPYAATWDTTAVADGLYDLRVVATDNIGNASTSALVTNVRVDNTNPTGSVTGPASSANVRGAAVSVSSNSADGGSGVANATLQRSPAGAGTWTTISTDTVAPYAATWDTTAVADGLYDLRVVTTDNVGNTFTSATVANVRVDNTNPTGSVTAPASSANVRGAAVSVSSNSADGGSGVANATLQRSPAGAGTWTTISTDTVAPYAATWDTTAVADGLYDLRAVTTDNAGNTFTSALVTNVRVDNTNPTGSVTAPASSAVVSGAAVAVSSGSADGGSGVANATFQSSLTGAGSWTTIAVDTTAPYSVNWDTTVIRDLFYDLRVVTTDNAGNTFTSSLVTNVKVTDVTAPGNGFSLYSVSPASSSYLSGSTVFYRGTGGGSGGSFQLTNSVFDLGSLPLNSAFPALGGTTTGWTHTAQTVSTPTNGPFTTTNAFTWTEGTTSSPTEAVTSTDNVGLQSTTTLTFTNDSTNPTGSVTAPAAAANIRQTVAVSSNSADAASGVATATFQRSPAGAGTWTTISSDAGAPYSVNWDTTGVSDGLYDLRVVTADNVGNSSTSATVANVRVDNTNPTGSVTAPASSANVRGAAVTVSADSADSGSGVANATLQRSPAGAGTWTTIVTDSSAPYAGTWDTTAVADGLYDLRAVTTDNAGNTFTSSLATNVRVDNTNPANSFSLSSVSPASSSFLSGATVFYRGTGGGAGGSFQLTNTVTDGGSGPASSAFPALGGTTTGWTHTAQTISTPPGGPYTSTNAFSWSEGTSSSPTEAVVGSDNAGNSSAATLTFTNDSINPTGSVTAPASSANVRGAAVSVSSNSADGGSGVANATLQRSPAGAGTWTTISTDTSAPYSVSWNTTLVADGLYDLRAVTTDNVGNTLTSSLVTNVRVDNTNPTGSLGAPASSANVRGAAVAMSSDSADAGSGVASATFERSPAGAGTWTTISADASAPYAASWNTTLVADGLYDLRVVTADNAGNTFTSALVTNVRVDNTNPTGSVTAPAPSANVRGAAVAVTSSSADAGSGVTNAVFQRSPAGAGTWTTISTDTGAPYAAAWDTTAVSDGVYDVRVVTTDNAGNTFTSSSVTNVRVDNTAPSTPTVSGGSLSWQSVASVAASASGSTDVGGSGLSGYEYRSSTDGGASWATATTGGATAIVTEQGETILQFRSIDLAGNVSAWAPASLTAGSTVRIDRTAPGGVSGTEIVNAGDFEDPVIGVGGTPTPAPASQGAWNVTSGSATGLGTGWQAGGGAQSVELNGTGPGIVSQTLTTVAGTTYRIRLMVAGDPDGGPAVKEMRVGWGGTALRTIRFDTTGHSTSSMGWQTITLEAAASSSSTLLAFESLTSGSYGPVVDAVSVTPESAPTVTGGSLSWQSTASVTVSGSGATDVHSGLSGYEYRTSTDAGSTWSTTSAGSSAVVSSEGETLVQFRSLDTAGNASAWAPVSATAGSTVRIDRTNPTAPTVAGGSLSWQDVASVDVTASGSAGGASGLAGYEYRTSTDAGSTWGSAASGASVTISSEGETLVQYRSLDTAGNASAWTPVSATAGSTVRIDRTDPGAPSVTGGSLSWQSVASITISASGGTGATSYERRSSADGGSTWSAASVGSSLVVSAEGETLVQFRGVDDAGNVSAWTPASATAGSTARIDRTNPTAPTVAGGSLSWQNVASVDVTASGSAGGASGLAGYEYRTSTDAGSTWGSATSGASVTISSEGETLVQYRSLDTAGNASAWTPVSATAGSTVRIDRTDPGAPTVTGGSLSWQSVASITISASGGTGATSYERRSSADGGSTWSAASAGSSLVVSAEGETLVQFRGVDDAGNVSAWTPASATAGSTVAHRPHRSHRSDRRRWLALLAERRLGRCDRFRLLGRRLGPGRLRVPHLDRRRLHLGKRHIGRVGDDQLRGRDAGPVPLARHSRKRLGLDAGLGDRRIDRAHRPYRPGRAGRHRRVPLVAERRLDHHQRLRRHRRHLLRAAQFG